MLMSQSFIRRAIHIGKQSTWGSALRSSSEAGRGYVDDPKGFKDFPFKYREERVVKIDNLSNLGQGVGRIKLEDGSDWVVFVPLVLPGEEVRVRIFRNMPTYSEADLVDVISPSSDRITPQCQYFTVCGGCQYQHISIEKQRFFKKQQVQELLARIGGLDNVEVDDTVGTSDLYGYRSKITPHYDAPPKRNPQQDLKIGFKMRGTRVVLDIEQCIIATDAINAEYQHKREEVKSAVKANPPKKGATLLFRECDDLHIETDQRAIANQTVNGIKFQYKAGEFFQNNAFALPLMVDHVIEQAIEGGEMLNLIDTYCGSGLFALCAAKHFEVVYGVEVSDAAIKAAGKTAKANGIKNVNFVCGQSEAIFSNVQHLDRDKTVMIIDPPRKGCDQQFLDQLALYSPKKCVYVSCDPATQARDAKEIVKFGYKITNVTPMDLFPQTRHIENVITFVRP